MRKYKLTQKGLCLLLASFLMLSGCASHGESEPGREEVSAESEASEAGASEAGASETGASEIGASEAKVSDTALSPVRGLPIDFKVNPEDFSLLFQTEDGPISVSEGTTVRTVSDYQEEGNHTSWSYPEEQISVLLTAEADYLDVEIVSEKDRNDSFIWPSIAADTYYIPFGEGKRVPSKDPAWQSYLKGQEFSVLEQLSMPFWISSEGEYSVMFIMEEPFRTQMNFTADSGIAFEVSHEYPQIDENRVNRYRIYLTDKNPVNAAKLYRNYVIEQGKFTTLEQKAEDNPDIRKLYGAPFIYLWGDFVVSAEDINWQAFRQSAASPIMDYLLSFAENQENGAEFLAAMDEIRQQDYVAVYQKNIVCSYISQVLKQKDFYDPSIFTQSSEKLDILLEKGFDNLSESEKLQVNKYALAANLPQVFADAGQWMNAGTTDVIHSLKESGVDQAWIGLNSWEQAYAKPELVKAAVNQGYLMASYDSYHSIHEPGKEQWITAKFDDTSLYEEATVLNKDGKKESGFQNVGRKLNPVQAFPAVKARMEDIMSNQIPFNSWFIDCDATGEIYDDYTVSHVTTQEEDLAARLERMSYIREQYKLVVGSEGGNDFAASTIAYAHGIELKSFSWMDADMKSNKDSEFYIGKYYNPNGGVAEHFAKRIPIKGQYYTVFVDPKYDIPLFKLVYNDSVITSYHWDWSTFKIQGATQDRMVREVLYNVPPLYHLDADEWGRYKQDIANHQTVWSEFSKLAVTKEMTDFAYLSGDGAVQKIAYGDKLIAVANFGNQACEYGENEIPPHSVLIGIDGQETVYTPSVQEQNR